MNQQIEKARIIKKISLSATIEAMQPGQQIDFPANVAQPDVVYKTAKRLECEDRRYEVHRNGGNSTVTRVL